MNNERKQQVLFLCTHNSCRSQMAEGLLRHINDTDYASYSAGIEQTHVHPLAVVVMKEIGIDLSDHYSKIIDQYKDYTFDYVITVCDHAKETCPFFPGKQVIHQSFPDPSIMQGDYETQLQAFRDTRDMIHQWILEIFTKKTMG